jgi:Holliday junction resolvasome RuvABC endonuclease subunit
LPHTLKLSCSPAITPTMVLNYRSLLAVDPSLTCSGWALFSVTDGRITAVGKVRSDPPRFAMGERLRVLQERIEEVLRRLNLGQRDILVCEAATTIKDPHNALKVENVRSIFESVARTRAVTVPGRINPRSVHLDVMGLKGKQMPRVEVKRAALRTVQFLYESDLSRLGLDNASLAKHQDIVDAVLIGRLALMRLKSAQDGSFPIESMFSIGTLQNRRSWRVRAVPG